MVIYHHFENNREYRDKKWYHLFLTGSRPWAHFYSYIFLYRSGFWLLGLNKKIQISRAKNLPAKKSKLTIRRVQNCNWIFKFSLKQIKFIKNAKNLYETYRFLCGFHLFRDIFSPVQSLLNEGSLAYPFRDPSWNFPAWYRGE